MSLLQLAASHAGVQKNVQINTAAAVTIILVSDR